MKRVLRFITYIFVFFTALIIFLPKESLYNLLEKKLFKNQIIISNELKEEKILSFVILNGDLYYQGVNRAKVSEATLKTYILFTNISLRNINIYDFFGLSNPFTIDEIIFEHFVLNPHKVKIKASGIFGELLGEINLFSGDIRIELNASSEMKSSYLYILKYMKYENERYIYEYKY